MLHSLTYLYLCTHKNILTFIRILISWKSKPDFHIFSKQDSNFMINYILLFHLSLASLNLITVTVTTDSAQNFKRLYGSLKKNPVIVSSVIAPYALATQFGPYASISTTQFCKNICCNLPYKELPCFVVCGGLLYIGGSRGGTGCRDPPPPHTHTHTQPHAEKLRGYRFPKKN